MTGQIGKIEPGQQQPDQKRSDMLTEKLMRCPVPRYVKPSREVLFQRLNDGSVLLDLVSEQYIGLDPVATNIWLLLVEDGNTEKVIVQMLEKYDVDEETLRNDVANFIEELQAEGLVQLEAEPS
jgi:hypothetical protein